MAYHHSTPRSEKGRKEHAYTIMQARVKFVKTTQLTIEKYDSEGSEKVNHDRKMRRQPKRAQKEQVQSPKPNKQWPITIQHHEV
jgi:hypothetical protein